jgi:hypothetical protein
VNERRPAATQAEEATLNLHGSSPSRLLKNL